MSRALSVIVAAIVSARLSLCQEAINPPAATPRE